MQRDIEREMQREKIHNIYRERNAERKNTYIYI